MKRLAVIISGLAIMLAAVSVAVSRTSGPIAYACTGGSAGLEFASTEADLIFLGRVLDVGDVVNHAPTLTPTSTPTKVPLFHTPEGTPVSPPVAPPQPIAAPAIDLVGIHARFQVETVYAGERMTEDEVGAESRTEIEEELRRIEAGEYGISSCAIDAFVPRFTLGARYLLFLRHEAVGDYTLEAYRVEGDSVVAGDEGLLKAGLAKLAMSSELRERFFPWLPVASFGEQVSVNAPAVPLTSVLRAVAYLRNDPRIYPPNTGTAGLLPARAAP